MFFEDRSHQIHDLQIFPPSVGCLFTLLMMMPCDTQKPGLATFCFVDCFAIIQEIIAKSSVTKLFSTV
jgi:hypothetical protein